MQGKIQIKPTFDRSNLVETIAYHLRTLVRFFFLHPYYALYVNVRPTICLMNFLFEKNKWQSIHLPDHLLNQGVCVMVWPEEGLRDLLTYSEGYCGTTASRPLARTAASLRRCWREREREGERKEGGGSHEFSWHYWNTPIWMTNGRKMWH